MKFLPKLLCVLLGSWTGGSAFVNAAQVPKWSVHEIALVAAGTYQNAYTEVEVTAQFTGPNGTTTTVRGFWDGGRDFKVRFCPTAKGEWKYTIQSSPVDGGLTSSGSFTVVAPQPGNQGFLRRDAEHPTSFVFDNGTRFFMLGTTYYGIVGNARSSERWKESVTNLTRYGINKVRMYLYASGQAAKPPLISHPPTSPFTDRAADRLDLDHWRAADRVVRFMGEQGVLADLIVFPYRRKKADVGTLAQDERYLRYVQARYAAFPNVLWCLVNEWNYSVLPQDYWNTMGRLALSEDPWAKAGDNLRALTIHQQTRSDWNFPNETWPSHANLQFGVRNQGTATRVGDEWKPPADGVRRFRHGDEWGNYSIVRNWTGKQPVVNDEFGYIGEPKDESEGKQPGGGDRRFTREKHRHTLWGIAVGGGYAAAGDKNDYADGRPYFSGNWHDVPEYGDLKRLADFFTARGLEYWKMAPHNELIKTGTRVYALAEPGRSYVIYAAAGGEFAAELPAGDYAALRFDPRTGEESSLPRVAGGGVSRFSLPDGQDWVVRLRRIRSSTQGANHSLGKEPAVKFGVHEIVLTGDGSVANPFDTIATVKFVPPTGEKNAKTVHAFFDGDNTWRARVYLSETGEWKWSSACATDKGMNDKTGTFAAVDSKLRGRLLVHPKNPRQWMTEDGRWFLNLNDTSYFLLCSHDGVGQPVSDDDFKAYVKDAVAHGITSFRSWIAHGPKALVASGNSDRNGWQDLFADKELSRLNLDHLRVADQRLKWMLDEYPNAYMQFILFPLGTRYGQDEQNWKMFAPEQKERVMRTMIARYAAYPQLFWLVANDAHYGPKHPNNNAYAREVGAYFRQHDPWQHPMSTGHARKVEFFFGGEDWSSYIHLEDNFDLGATQYAKYHQHAKPVFLGEDRYEQDHPTDRDPNDMRYFQRRLFWAWLLSGGSTNYGGRWWPVHPYSQTGKRPTPSPWPKDTHVFSTQLTGLDSVKFIRDYFEKRKIELSDFEQDQNLVKDADDATGVRSSKLMRRGQQEFLIYLPNAAADDRNTRADESKTPGVVLDLSAASGKFTVEWYRAADGTAQPGGVIEGGKSQTLRSPWRGQDCVVRLRRE